MSDLSRRSFLGATLAAGIAPSFARAGVDGPPNVLVISSDEHNPFFFSGLGHPVQTPRLDAFMAESVNCTRAYTSAPVCAPTRASFLTSLWPQEHGQIQNAKVLDPAHYTLARFFGEQGYDTACFGKLHSNADESKHFFGFDQLLNRRSKERWDAARRQWWDGSGGPPAFDPKDQALFESMPDTRMKGKVLTHPSQSSDYPLLRGAIDYLEQPRERPFFLYASLVSPHFPFHLPKDYYYLYDPAQVPLPPQPDLDKLGALSPAVAKATKEHGWERMTPEMHRLCMARYMGAVTFTDWMVGELLDAVDRAGLRQNTLVLYVSDHGDMAAEKGLWLKHTMYDAAARKPLMVRMPGVIKPGTTLQAPLNEVDILPSVAGLVGLGSKLPARLSGVDRSGWMRGQAPDPQARAFSGLLFHGDKPWMSMAANKRFKYIRYYRKNEVYAQELYDLDTDPHERSDLSQDPSHAQRMASLDKDLEAHLAGLKGRVTPGE